MGFFHVPPPPPVVAGAAASQPNAPGKIAAAITLPPVVNNPPFDQRDGSNYAAIVAAWNPPLGPLPTLPRYIVPPGAAVVAYNPYANLWIAGVLQSWQPADPAPTLARNLSPAITGFTPQVDNPPFGWLETIIDPWLQPDPLPTVPKYLVQPGATVVTQQSPYQKAWIATVLQSWQIVDPLPTLGRKLTPPSVDRPPPGVPNDLAWPSIIGSWQPPDPLPTLARKLTPPSVDNPPALLRQLFSYPDAPFRPQQPIYLPQAATVTQSPFGNVWLAGVLQSWQPIDLAPTLARKLTPPSVDAPPFSHYGRDAWSMGLSALSWQPPDPLPTLARKLTPPSVDNPPTLLRQQIVYPDAPVQIQRPLYFPQTATVTVTQSPYVNAWLVSVIQSWQLVDPAPTLARKLTPSSVDNPPFSHPGRDGWTIGISAFAWQPPDPQPTLNPKLTPPSVDAPPFSHYGRDAWASDLASRSWQPPDPLPTLPRILPQPFIPAVVNDPPFSHPGRNQLMAIWWQWLPPDPLPTPSYAISIVQGGIGPVTLPARFTVSGPDVRDLFGPVGDVSHDWSGGVSKRTV